MSERKDVRTEMKAVRIHSFGGPEVVRYEDAPRPEANAGEVLVRVRAAGANPADWKLRQGYFGTGMPLPVTLGFDFSGVVEVAGAGVTRWKAGDEVLSSALGAQAEFIAVKEDQLAAKPKDLDHVRAAALPTAALTAWNVLFAKGGLEAGQKVLIHGAAGGVGSFAVQLAKEAGATVIATASAGNRAAVLELGADEVIDYAAERFEEKVRDADLVLDTQGGETQTRSYAALKKGGILLSIVQPPSGGEAERHGVRAEMVFNTVDVAVLESLAAKAAAGKLKVAIAETLPLSQAREAQDRLQTGHARGKIVLLAG